MKNILIKITEKKFSGLVGNLVISMLFSIIILQVISQNSNIQVTYKVKSKCDVNYILNYSSKQGKQSSISQILTGSENMKEQAFLLPVKDISDIRLDVITENPTLELNAISIVKGFKKYRITNNKLLNSINLPNDLTYTKKENGVEFHLQSKNQPQTIIQSIHSFKYSYFIDFLCLTFILYFIIHIVFSDMLHLKNAFLIIQQKILEKTQYRFLVFFGSIFSLYILKGIDFESNIATYIWCDYTLYWNIGESYNGLNGDFSFTNAMTAFRGYIFPFTCYLMQKLGTFLGSITFGYYIFASILYAFMFSIVIPKFLTIFSVVKREIIFRISYLVLIFSFIFWYGLFLYPLSDLFAFMFALISLYLLHKLNSYNIYSDMNTKIKRFATAMLMGGICYITYNIRTIYQFMGIAIFLMFLYESRKRGLRLLLEGSIGILIGAIIAGLPQLLMNRSLLGIISIKVPASDIILFQLKSGLIMQKVETYIGNMGNEYISGGYSDYGVVYDDAIGIELLKREGIESFKSIKDYITFVLKYPLDVIGIYSRHLLNILNHVFPEQYIKNLYKPKAVYTVSNYLCIYFASICIYIKTIKFKHRSISKYFVYCFILSIPSIAILIGAVEMRFFYPMYCLLYIVISVCIFEKKIWQEIYKHLFIYVLVSILLFIPLIACWSNTYASLRYFIQSF